jgi:hypothetical protein
MQITPGTGNFRLNQNNVNVLTSEGTSAVVNTLYLKQGSVGLSTTTPSTTLQVYGGTGQSVSVSGGQIGGLNSTPLNADQAVPLGYLQANYSPSLWGGTLNGNIWNGAAAVGNVGIGTTDPGAKLQVNGGLILKRTTVSDANYTASSTDYIIAYTSISANRTVALPDALCVPGRFFVVLDESGDASASKQIVIDPEGGTHIIGQDTLSLQGPYNSVYVFCGSSAWYIL